jgi:deoxyribodipyrimidine photo-lyase
VASVLWFRRDLRLTDHPALAAALAEGEVVPLFVLDPVLYERAGAPRQAFLLGCLERMQVVVRTGDPQRVVRAVAREVEAEHVYVTKDFGPYGRARDAGLEDLLVEVGTPYAVSPDELKPYKVFTPYYRQWRARGWERPIPAPTSPRWLMLESDPLPAAPDAVTLEPGEEAGLRRVAVPDEYRRRRDPPPAGGPTPRRG